MAEMEITIKYQLMLYQNECRVTVLTFNFLAFFKLNQEHNNFQA